MLTHLSAPPPLCLPTALTGSQAESQAPIQGLHRATVDGTRPRRAATEETYWSYSGVCLFVYICAHDRGCVWVMFKGTFWRMRLVLNALRAVGGLELRNAHLLPFDLACCNRSYVHESGLENRLYWQCVITHTLTLTVIYRVLLRLN